MLFLFLFLFIGNLIQLNVGCCCFKPKIEPITNPIQHAEGPHWDSKNQVLYYVDTFQSTVYRFNTKSEVYQLTKQKIEGRDSIGIVIPVKHKENEFVVAADRIIYKLEWNPTENNTGKYNQILMVDENKPLNQANDGKADALGRLWAGTLTREKNLSVSNYGGALYKFDFNKEVEVTTQIANTSISNGLAWSSDNKRFFYSDSETKQIWVFDFDLEKGLLGEKRVLFNLKDHPELKGIADGLTVDSKNNLWIALYGGHGVIHVDGETGKLLRFLKLPVTYCTSVCFGGVSQDILFVTTSRMKLKGEELEKEPTAGAVFAVHGLGVTGPAPFECVLK